MDTSLNTNFTKKTEAIIAQFGFKDLKSFIKNQTLLLLMARIEKYEAEDRRFEAKYRQPYDVFRQKIVALQGSEIFEEDDDYLDWRFAREAVEKLQKQKQELEDA